MAASVQVVPVPGPEFLDQAVSAYIVQGFTVANRTPYSVTMIKRKNFEVLWAVIGFILCVIPLLIYLIVYATQSDQVVEIRVVEPAALSPVTVQMSPDGRCWWDGAQWQDADHTVPPHAQRSHDGRMWWDTVRWRPLPDQALGTAE